ncbi:MAG: alpha/beta hydrolase [Chloroflexi bacterium]|nr:alpha/beta hydrolase [Chloroflexota bacterium]
MTEQLIAPWRPTEAVVPGLDLQYLEAGAGHPVVLLHGWAAFKEIWWGTLHALAPHYHGIALEWPGHGGSRPRENAARLTDFADLVVQTCEILGLERITLVGHSMGGRIAALLSLLHPELVARLVLVDAALDPAHIAPYGKRMLEIRDIQRTVMLSRQIGRGLGPLLRPAAHDHRGGFIRPFLRRSYYTGLADPHVLQQCAMGLFDESLDARLPEIQQPTLVISGERDPLILPRQARRAAEAIPNAQLQIIRRALHTPMDDRPAEFQRVLLDFLDHVPPASPSPAAGSTADVATVL